MSASRSGQDQVLQQCIDDLPVPTRARRWLLAAGVSTVSQLIARTEDDLLTLDNFSHTSLTHVKAFLAQHGLSLSVARPHEITGSMIRSGLSNRRLKLLPRERQVLKCRHGTADQKPKTLAEVGRKLKLTRERVRQIQKLAEQKIILFHHATLSQQAASPVTPKPRRAPSA